MEEELRDEMERRVAKEVEEGVTLWVQVLVSVAVMVVVATIVFKFVWAWVVPDLFPGAVAQGLISANLTWLAALKVGVLVALPSGSVPAIVEDVKRRL